MHTKGRFPNVLFGGNLRADSAALAILVLLLFLIFVFLFLTLTAQPAQAQTYQVIYNFTGGKDGATPVAGLTMDKRGNLYGTASSDHSTCCGSVFRLGKTASGWVLVPLYDFAGGDDGASPNARVVFGPDGSLYGTTVHGGGGNCNLSRGGRVPGCGIVFSLKRWTDSTRPVERDCALSLYRRQRRSCPLPC